MNKYMEIAIEEARTGFRSHHGGPFGAVIVKNNEIIAKSHNKSLLNKDATCHGEIEVIREASKKLNTHDLTGCELYVTGEPCPMCLCACMWANIDKIYYGCNLKDNSNIGFRDEKFDEVLGGRHNLEDYLICIDREECLKLFEEYNNSPEKEIY